MINLVKSANSEPRNVFFKALTEEEIEHFYQTYDKLWSEGAYIEAYCLLRLVFGILTKPMIDKLYRQGHLLNSFDIYNYARNKQ